MEVLFDMRSEVGMKTHRIRGFQKTWHELEVIGVPLEPPEFRLGAGSKYFDDEIFIEQQGDITGNCVTQLGARKVAYILNPLIINRLHGTAQILEYWLELPWEDNLFQWLVDPAESGTCDEPYCVLGDPDFRYARKSVLNHRIQQPMKRGAVLDGLLLGSGHRPIPDEFRRGAEIPARLVLIDQWFDEYSQEFDLLCIPNEAPPTKPRKRRLPLFPLVDTAPEYQSPSFDTLKAQEELRSSQKRVTVCDDK